MTIEDKLQMEVKDEDIHLDEDISTIEEETTVQEQVIVAKPKKGGSKSKKEDSIPQDPDKVSLDLEELDGIGKATADKLRAYGINDIPSLALAQAPELIEKLSPGGSSKNVSQDSCIKLILSANKYLQDTGILTKPLVSSTDLLQRTKDRKRFTTGSLEIDNFFGGGGFESRAVTEVYGAFGSGKSQLCYCAAVLAANMDRKVLFVDTENTYSPDRIDEIAELKKMDVKKVHDNILVLKPATVSMLKHFIDRLEQYVSEYQIQMVIVDSIVALHKSEFFGRGQLAPRQQGLNSIMSKLVRVAEFYDVGVLITNHIIANPDPYTPGSEIAAGGNSIAHFCVGLSSLVVTETNGIKQIQDIQIGERIFNGVDGFVTVRDKSEVMDKQTVEIRSNNFINATLDHRFPVFSQTGDFIQDKQVRDIKTGEYFQSPKEIYLFPENEQEIPIKLEKPIKKLIKLNDGLRTEIKSSLKGRFKHNKDLEKQSGITIRQLRRVINEGYPTMIESGNGLIQYSLNRQLLQSDYESFKTNWHQNIAIPEFVNESILRLYGAWLCDGDKGEKAVCIRIRKHKDQRQYLQYLGELCKKEFNITNYIISNVKNTDCCQLNINSRELLSVLKGIDINKLVLLNRNKILEFCASLIDGDGSISEDRIITFSQKSHQFISNIQILLLRLGIQSHISRTNIKNNFNNKQESYHSLLILGAGKNLISHNMKNMKKLEGFKGYEGKRQFKVPITNHDVKYIKPSGTEKVVDISVDGEYFLCNGVITHNSTHRIYLQKKGAKKPYTIATIIDSPRMPKNQTSFELKPEGVVWKNPAEG